MKRAPFAAALLGALTVPGFAPFSLSPLPLFTLAALILLWRAAQGVRTAAFTGFCFGLGYFGAGVSWVYVSLHDFGGMPAALAGSLTLLFCAYLALYPALAGAAYRALGPASRLATLGALPALWTVSEWLRGHVFTGFSWLELGYTQVPGGGPAGLLPVLGIHAATFATVLGAALLVEVHAAVSRRQRIAWGAALALLWAAGYGLAQVDWTRPEGGPLKVALLQGNIPQEMKWQESAARATLESYAALAAQAGDARLVVLPETALPVFLEDLPADYLDRLSANARARQGDVLAGVVEHGGNDYYNSVLSVGADASQTYRKVHLVPFGEFIPLKPLFGWFLDWAQIPLADLARGATVQPPLAVAGQSVGINICYEDAFGSEIARQLPQATLLVNASNVAWFGRSLAPRQHLQMSQARALETGRYMLRATNTGVTAIIDPRGRLVAAAPEFSTAVLQGEVRGYAGATPYVRWRDAPIMMLCAVLLAAAVARPRRAG